MNVLVLGSGAREHALAWKIKQSPRCSKVFLHPGNAGTQTTFPVLTQDKLSLDALVDKAGKQGIGLVVVGPEQLLAEGYADAFRHAGFLVVGPSKEAALLETSKAFAKTFMKSAGIPTAGFETVESADQLSQRLDARNEWPVVLKLDGLAAGKGVVIAQNKAEANDFADSIWKSKRFGEGPHAVVIEECLVGKEMSYIGLCDGDTFLPLPTATDYKRLKDRDEGPNTGGMGCVSPSPFLTPELEQKINKQIIGKILSELESQKIQYLGALYVGLMVDKEGEPRVLEFNARFGDPETQAVLLRLKSDFLELLIHTAKGTLSQCPRPEAEDNHSIYVVGSAKGYPNAPVGGDTITISNLKPEAQVFFAGVRRDQSHLVTHGGRVLGLGVCCPTLKEAQLSAYEEMSKVSWDGMHYRRDIGNFE